MDGRLVIPTSRHKRLPCLMSAVRSRHYVCGLLLAFLFGGLFGACDATSTKSSDDLSEQCEFSSSDLVDRATGRDAIPALTNPPLVGAEAEGASYLSGGDRVIGLLFGKTPLAVPHDILWHHEIVNLDNWVDHPIAVTYCPLTGSSLAFDREAVDGAEFGVSGLLLQRNLVMYDRQESESLWPQMGRDARCGPETGTSLSMLPVIEMTWGRWRRLHPETKVLSSNTGFHRAYATARSSNPRSKPSADSSPVFSGSSRKRVLGLPEGQGLAFPFDELDNGAALRVIHVRRDVVVFWHRAARSAMAFRPRVEGKDLSFTVRDGRIVDEETGSTWRVDGRAVAGPKVGARLPPVEAAHTAFQVAWTDFHPNTRIWPNSS